MKIETTAAVVCGGSAAVGEGVSQELQAHWSCVVLTILSKAAHFTRAGAEASHTTSRDSHDVCALPYINAPYR